MSESYNLTIHERTTLLLFSQALVFVFEKISLVESQVSNQCVVIWRRGRATWTMRNWNGHVCLGGIAG